MDASKIADAVKAEIERQQANVDYDAMGADELEKVMAALQSRLALCKAAVEKRGLAAPDVTDAAPKKEAPKMVAKKAEGTWPELPWGGERRSVSLFFFRAFYSPRVRPPSLTHSSRACARGVQWRASRTPRRSTTTSPRTCRSAS